LACRQDDGREPTTEDTVGVDSDLRVCRLSLSVAGHSRALATWSPTSREIASRISDAGAPVHKLSVIYQLSKYASK